MNQTVVKARTNECCTRPENLVRIYPNPKPKVDGLVVTADIRKDLIIDQCSVCNAKHYIAWVDPGKALSKGSSVG
jgi:hypothetical protein